jgi:hypothetical protein
VIPVSPLLDEGVELSLSTGQAGVTLVLASSPLTRLNYFDGKFLRAEHLRREQDYVRRLVRYANQGLGAGIVYGYSTTLGGGRLSIGAGLAVDGAGRTLLLPEVEEVEIQRLVAPPPAAPRPQTLPRREIRPQGVLNPARFTPCQAVTGPEGPTVRAGTALYLICIAHTEQLCGEEDVFGQLCEQACVSASERPWLIEGIVVRALPLRLGVPLATSRAVGLDRRHLRSLVASAYYAQEWRDAGSLISGDGIRTSDTWCLGALGATGGCIPLGVLAQRGNETVYFDAWTARRERMETPARQYWAGIMRMRHWSAYLAQILQFQCQLHDGLGATGTPEGEPTDPCAGQSGVLREAQVVLGRLEDSYLARVRAMEAMVAGPGPAGEGLPEVGALKKKLSAALATLTQVPRDRMLIASGIVELPPAGYLPVTPGTVSVETQVRRYLGEGVDLRFCAVREDFVAHALEAAQHMERISLLTGLDDPARRPAMDILVPEAEPETPEVPTPSGYEARLALRAGLQAVGETDVQAIQGLARGERRDGGGKLFHIAVVHEADTLEAAMAVSSTFGAVSGTVGSDRIRTSARAAERMRTRMDEVLREPLTAGLAARMAGRALEARLRRASAEAGHAAPAEPEIEAVAEAAAAGPAGRRADAAVWMTMRIDGDVFAAPVGESIAASIEMATAGLSKDKSAVEVTTIQGTLTVTETGALASGGRRAVCAMAATQSSRKAANGVAEEQDPPKDLNLTLELTREGNEDEGKTSILAAPKGIAFDAERGTFFEITTTWQSGAATATSSAVTLIRSGPNEERRSPIGQLSLTRNPAAFAEGHPLRTGATAGLQLIEDGLVRSGIGTDQYADAGLRHLIPPAPAVPSTSLRATRDWVLFHRRRTKTCGGETPVPIPAPALRPYALVALDARSRDNARKLVGVVAQDPSKIDQLFSLRMPWQYVGRLTFREGASALETPALELRTAWKAAIPADMGLAWMGLSDVGGEDEAIVRGRAGATAASLAPLLASDPLLTTTVLTRLPQAVDLKGATDLMVAMVYPAEREPQRVIRLVVTNQFEIGHRFPRAQVTGAAQHLYFVTTDQEGAPTSDIGAQVGELGPFLRELNHDVGQVTIAPAGQESQDASRARAERLLASLRGIEPNLLLNARVAVSELAGDERKLLDPVGTMPTATDVLFLNIIEIG